MKKICTLDYKYNKCPFLEPGQHCTSSNPCAMARIYTDKDNMKYTREPRWYEEYYAKRCRSDKRNNFK